MQRYTFISLLNKHNHSNNRNLLLDFSYFIPGGLNALLSVTKLRKYVRIINDDNLKIHLACCVINIKMIFFCFPALQNPACINSPKHYGNYARRFFFYNYFMALMRPHMHTHMYFQSECLSWCLFFKRNHGYGYIKYLETLHILVWARFLTVRHNWLCADGLDNRRMESKCSYSNYIAHPIPSSCNTAKPVWTSNNFNSIPPIPSKKRIANGTKIKFKYFLCKHLNDIIHLFSILFLSSVNLI